MNTGFSIFRKNVPLATTKKCFFWSFFVKKVLYIIDKNVFLWYHSYMCKSIYSGVSRRIYTTLLEIKSLGECDFAKKIIVCGVARGIFRVFGLLYKFERTGEIFHKNTGFYILLYIVSGIENSGVLDAIVYRVPTNDSEIKI